MNDTYRLNYVIDKLASLLMDNDIIKASTTNEIRETTRNKIDSLMDVDFTICRPKTAKDIIEKLKEGITCECETDLVNIVEIMFSGRYFFTDYYAVPSKNEGWTLFIPKGNKTNKEEHPEHIEKWANDLADNYYTICSVKWNEMFDESPFHDYTSTESSSRKYNEELKNEKKIMVHIEPIDSSITFFYTPGVDYQQ